MNIRVADEVWVATALLQREHPEREDFAVGEIVERARRERMQGSLRPGVQWHVSLHCVANKPPNPARHRMLVETRPRRRRLFRPGDPVDEGRRGGKMRPDAEDLPPRYRALVRWYDSEYVKDGGRRGATEANRELLALGGRVSGPDLERFREAAGECESVDERGW